LPLSYLQPIAVDALIAPPPVDANILVSGFGYPRG
jgi:hypothetical protein